MPGIPFLRAYRTDARDGEGLKKENAPLDHRWVNRFAIFALILTTLPYMLGFFFENRDWVFTGFLFGVDDGNSYIAKMLRGANGDWLFRTPYSTVPQSGLFVFLPYLLLGKLSAPPAQHTQLVVLFQIFRIGAGFALIRASYDFIGVFVQEEVKRRLGTVLAVFGGGLGWVLILAGRPELYGAAPLEIYSPESFGFLAFYGLPHLSIGRALLLWGFLAYLQPLRAAGRKTGWLAGGLWFAMGFFNPLNIAIAWVVVIAHLAVDLWLENRVSSSPSQPNLVFKRALPASQALLLSSPWVVYSLLASSLDPYFRLWTAQNTITSPHPVHYLLAYGWLIIPAVIGARRLLREGQSAARFPIVWAALLPLLAYAPYTLQRRLPEGIFLSLIILGLNGLPVQIQGRWRRLGVAAYSFMLLPTTLIIFAGSILALRSPGRPLYRSRAEVEAYEFLAETARFDEVVLARFEIGNPLPAWAPVRVIIGHGPESIGLAELQPAVEHIMNEGFSSARAEALIQNKPIDYLYYGLPVNKVVAWSPWSAEELELIFSNDEAAIFRWRDSP